MDPTLQHHLDKITSGIKKLKVRTERLERENEELRQSVFGYLQQLEAQKSESQKQVRSIQNQQIGQSLVTDKKKLQKEIDKLITLLDQCIASVNANL